MTEPRKTLFERLKASLREAIAWVKDERGRRKRAHFARVKRDYEALRADPEEWAEHQEQIREWDCTLMDGLDDDDEDAD